MAGKKKKQTHYNIENDNGNCKPFCHVRLFLYCADLRLIIYENFKILRTLGYSLRMYVVTPLMYSVSYCIMV